MSIVKLKLPAKTFLMKISDGPKNNVLTTVATYGNCKENFAASPFYVHFYFLRAQTSSIARALPTHAQIITVNRPDEDILESLETDANNTRA